MVVVVAVVVVAIERRRFGSGGGGGAATLNAAHLFVRLSCALSLSLSASFI